MATLRTYDAQEDDKVPLEGLADAEGNELSHVAGTFCRAWSDRKDARISVNHDGKNWVVDSKGVIGVISTGTTVVRINPKVPMSHFGHLAAAAGSLNPSVALNEVLLNSSEDFCELIMSWFVKEMKNVLSAPLFRGYRTENIVGETWAGTLDFSHVIRRLHGGRLEPKVSRSKLTEDIPVNRTLKAALERVSEVASLPWLAGQAADLLDKLQNVGPFRQEDLDVETPRRMAHYATALKFARDILENTLLGYDAGSSQAYCFLIPTAMVIENGIRNILRKHFRVNHNVHVRAKNRCGFKVDTPNTTRGFVTFNPDLVFESNTTGKLIAVGDVKHKVLMRTASWDPRKDLEQVMAFSMAPLDQPINHAALFKFSETPSLGRGADAALKINLRDLEVWLITWPIREGMTPTQSCTEMLETASAWIKMVKKSCGVPDAE